ncbi:PilW family protein [Alteromonas ponticola]|uniref:Prepilin-type N-terminal cleavage/methylation domain-containing protein n=1 Tax=Alteromonas ponticola TaxID=2720613 RepID=A0ABX1QYN2_9ALTE|nr:PilW family protein [Alteromonas ponticola]NMH58959.1 prepilin-type N-terminal cleavage/methylation domain-containing protein [Alteromonas ponticola]
MKQRGFSLVELMISLVLGLVISGAIIQSLVSSKVTNSLNDAIAQVQESGRFIMQRLSRELIQAGRYDQVSARVDNSTDLVVEAGWIQNRPVALAGDYVNNATLGASQGISGAHDELVINLLGSMDCTGSRHGYAADDEFHVVNHYFISNSQLKCTGYDGRVLRGLKVATTTPVSVVLLDNIESFQVQYGVSAQSTVSEGQAVRYVTADELAALRLNNQHVIAIRLGLLLKSDRGQVQQTIAPEYAVLNETAVTVDKSHYFQVFSKTLTLRNMKNFVRNAQ